MQGNTSNSKYLTYTDRLKWFTLCGIKNATHNHAHASFNRCIAQEWKSQARCTARFKSISKRSQHLRAPRRFLLTASTMASRRLFLHVYDFLILLSLASHVCPSAFSFSLTLIFFFPSTFPALPHPPSLQPNHQIRSFIYHFPATNMEISKEFFSEYMQSNTIVMIVLVVGTFITGWSFLWGR